MGNVGTTLACLLAAAGWNVVAVSSRSRESARRGADFVEARTGCRPEVCEGTVEVAARARVVVVAVPDDAVRHVAAQIAESHQPVQCGVVAHTSGSLSSQELSPVRKRGARVLSIHPIQSVPDPEVGLSVLPGSRFAVEGDEEALAVGRTIIEDVGGRPWTIPTDMKTLYHAGAVFASNYIVALLACSLDMCAAAGIDRDDALEGLLPLAKGTLRNVEAVGVPQSLTGPIERGEVDVIERHLQSVEREVPALLQVYVELARRTVGLAREKGRADPARLDEISALLDARAQAVMKIGEADR